MSALGSIGTRDWAIAQQRARGGKLTEIPLLVTVLVLDLNCGWRWIVPALPDAAQSRNEYGNIVC